MGKLVRNILMIVAVTHEALAAYYLLFEMVPFTILLESQIEGLKAGWPAIPLILVGFATYLINNKIERIAFACVSYALAFVFIVMSNITVYKALLCYTTGWHIAGAIVWANFASALCIMAFINLKRQQIYEERRTATVCE